MLIDQNACTQWQRCRCLLLPHSNAQESHGLRTESKWHALQTSDHAAIKTFRRSELAGLLLSLLPGSVLKTLQRTACSLLPQHWLQHWMHTVKPASKLWA